MFVITLFVDGVPQPYGMRFKDEDKAREVFDGIVAAREAPNGAEHFLTVTDDYGQVVHLPRSRLLVPMFLPIAGDVEARGDVEIAQARAAAMAQRKANADPVLMLHHTAAPAGLIRPPGH